MLKAFLPHHDIYVEDDENATKKKAITEKASEYVKLKICRFC